MATAEGVTRQSTNSPHWSLLCGKPGCAELARHIVELDWVEAKWHGVIGACDEHLEDLGLVALKARADFPPETDS